MLVRPRPPSVEGPKLRLGLHPKQWQALNTAATELLYGGGAGGGKSHTMRSAAIAWCYAIPGLQVYLFRRTHPDLSKNHMEGPSSFPALLGDFTRLKLAKINHNDNVIRFPNGSAIFLCHCQYEKDVYNYQGAEIHVLMIDELTHFSEKMYRYLRGRVRLGGLKLPAQYVGFFPRVLASANPGGVGHTWVKMTWIDLQPPMATKRMPKEEGGLIRQFIPALLEDNPTLTENDPDYEDRLYGLGNAALVKAMRHGDWNIVAGGMIDDVWVPAIHVMRPFGIPLSWRIDRAFDWGSSKPFSVGWYAESDGTEALMSNGVPRSFPRGTLFRFAEWYGWNGKANEGCRMLATGIAKGIKEREAAMQIADRVRAGPADSSIFDVVNGNSIAADMALVGVKWEKANKGPGSRINGAELVRSRLEASAEFPQEDPGLFVFDTCRHFLRTVPVLPRDDKNVDDVDSDAEDHAWDELRYRVLANSRRTTTQELPV